MAAGTFHSLRNLQSLILLCFITLFSTSAHAETTLKFATMNIKPYGIEDPNNLEIGIFREIHQSIAHTSKITVQDTLLPLKRMIGEIEVGKTNCGTFIRSSLNEVKYEQIAEVIPKLRMLLVLRKGIIFKGYEDLKGYRVAIPHGYSGAPIPNDPEIKRVKTNNYEQSVKLLSAGRVDAIAGSSYSILYSLKEQKLKHEDLGNIFIMREMPVWLQCTKGALSDKVKLSLRTAIETLKRDGTINKIMEKYGYINLTKFPILIN